MALNILRQPSLGGQIGEAFGTGLGSGLQSLAQLKFNQLQQGQQAARLQQGGLPEVLAYLDPQVQASYLREYGAQQQRSAQEQQQGMLDNLLSEIIQPQEGALPSLQGQDIRSQLMEQTLQGMGISPEAPAEISQQTSLQPTPQVPQQLVAKEEEPKVVYHGERDQRELVNFENKINTLPLSGTKKAKLREKVEKRHDRLIAQQDKIDNKTAPYYKSIKEAAEGAVSGDLRLDRMENLISKGNLPSPLTASFLEQLAHAIPIPFTGKSIGIDLKGTLLSDDAQEFSKLSKDFLKDVKKFFGARVTQQEVNQFLQTIPTLMQSDGGKLRVIKNMRVFNEMSRIKNDISTQIIEQNEGYRPHNLEALVEKRSKKDMDRLAQKFKSDIKSTRKDIKKNNISEPGIFEEGPFKALASGVGRLD